jgi:hypothetical protein
VSTSPGRHHRPLRASSTGMEHNIIPPRCAVPHHRSSCIASRFVGRRQRRTSSVDTSYTPRPSIAATRFVVGHQRHASSTDTSGSLRHRRPAADKLRLDSRDLDPRELRFPPRFFGVIAIWARRFTADGTSGTYSCALFRFGKTRRCPSVRECSTQKREEGKEGRGGMS